MESSAASAAAVVAADHHHPWSHPPEDRDNKHHGVGGGNTPANTQAESILTGTTYDREHVNLQTLLKFAMLAYKAGQYKQALGLLLKFRARSEARYGPATGEFATGEFDNRATGEFDNRDELLGLLVTTYCRLREWTPAEEIVRTMEFEGRGEAVKTLVWCYCEEKKWTEGERILCLTQTQTQTQTPLPSDLPLRNTSDFQDRDTETGSGPDIETMEMFAEVYRGQGDYDKAIKMCDGILQSVQDEECIQFFLAISALGQIYELKGDIIEATLHKDLLPPGIEGNRLPRSLSPVRSFTSFTFPSSPFPHLLMHLRMWTDA
jgi:tetratricopeptide (TPR) repeat protein